MTARARAVLLALLALLGALHGGVHALEHAAHPGAEACPHDHAHGEAPEQAPGPVWADAHHAGHVHVCPVCVLQLDRLGASPAAWLASLRPPVATVPVEASRPRAAALRGPGGVRGPPVRI